MRRILMFVTITPGEVTLLTTSERLPLGLATCKRNLMFDCISCLPSVESARHPSNEP